MTAVHNALLECVDPNQMDLGADSVVEFDATNVEQMPWLFIQSPSIAVAL
jgi:hypothetical protein